MYVGSTSCCSFIKLNLQVKQVSLGLVTGLFPWVLQFKPSQGKKIFQGFENKSGLEYLFQCSFHNSVATFRLQ